MGMSKWDKISKQQAKPLIEQMVLLDYRDTTWMNGYDLHGRDIYNDVDVLGRTFTVEKIDDFEYLGDGIVHSVKGQIVPSLAELFHQLPQRYAHKVNGVRIDTTRGYKDTIEGTNVIKVEFYKRKEADYVREGPLTARQMYIDLLKGAMEPYDERPGVLKHSSLPDATRNRDQMTKLNTLLEAAEQMGDSEVPDAVLLFAMTAFRQR